jgi:hypothetical protein
MDPEAPPSTSGPLTKKVLKGAQTLISAGQELNRGFLHPSGCQGCAASKVTLRQGFEVMVRGVAPEIEDIVDTTDHAAGNTPFYRRAGGGKLASARSVRQ